MSGLAMRRQLFRAGIKAVVAGVAARSSIAMSRAGDGAAHADEVARLVAGSAETPSRSQ